MTCALHGPEHLISHPATSYSLKLLCVQAIRFRDESRLVFTYTELLGLARKIDAIQVLSTVIGICVWCVGVCF